MHDRTTAAAAPGRTLIAGEEEMDELSERMGRVSWKSQEKR